jgi:hypothetical protein
VSPFTVFNAKEPVEIDEIKKYIEVLNKLIRRYCCSFSGNRSILTSMILDINIFRNPWRS